LNIAGDEVMIVEQRCDKVFTTLCAPKVGKLGESAGILRQKEV
jgi:hypothetical protein